MTRRRTITRLGARSGAVVAVVVAVLTTGPGAASAHPLGNFSVNHLNTLTFTSDRVIDDVIIDTAEIPTAQAESEVDADGDGTATDDELASYAAERCDAFNADARLQVDGAPTPFDVTSASFAYADGQAGLQTGRLDCRLEADVDLSVPRTIEFSDDYLPERVGWHEINARGNETMIVESPVPETSITDGLTTYPVDLLSSPLDVRTATFDVEPGGPAMADEGGPAVSDEASDAVTDDDAGDAAVADAGSDGAAAARDDLVDSRPGFLDGTVARVQDAFDDLIGRRDLTFGVGLLAMGLAVVLGASHALLPGHGKTVMAAYIAGRQGSSRDAVIVGATVTGTHTGGVLLLGLALTLSTTLAGETVLGWLGVTSGLLVAAIGLGLLISALRGRRSALFGLGHSHGDHGHSHGGHSHSHGDHGHAHGTSPSSAAHRNMHQDSAATSQASGVAVLAVTEPHEHRDHDHRDHEHHEHRDHHVHDYHVDDHHVHDHHEHDDHPPERRVSRRGLVGMGVAGGLVPSPSALIILLSAIALGRTWFGILLVVAYGAGMAGTLTLAGVLLVRVRDRYQHRVSGTSGSIRTAAGWWSNAVPYLTAALVLVVGIGLAIRSLILV